MFAQIVSNRSANSKDNPTTTSCWDNFSDHSDWLFDTNGFGSTDKSKDLAGTAIMNLKTDASVTISFPDSASGVGAVAAKDIDWIAGVILAPYEAGVWVEPKDNAISYNSLQSISFNIINKQNRGTKEKTSAAPTGDDDKATCY